MPRLTVRYASGRPIVAAALRGPGDARGVAGIVDSGADQTLLPLALASALGIPRNDLRKAEHASGGAADSSFPTWRLPYALRARVIVPFQSPRGAEAWGPEFELCPEFAEDTVPLFGQNDFFAAFVVTFEQARALFHLDYEGQS